MTHVDLTKIAARWPEWVQDRFLERVAIMREANNVDPEAETPREIRQIATQEALELLGVTRKLE